MRIRVIDLETTGVHPPAAICELGYCDLVVEKNPSTGEAEWQIRDGRETLVNPGIAIPPETSAIHHIVDEDVANSPPFLDFIDAIRQRNADEELLFCAHNCNFEQAWLTAKVVGDVRWICTYKCALRVWPEAPNFQNQTLRYYLKPEGLDRKIASVSHRAYPDAYVTAHILRELLRYATVDQLVKWTSEPALLVRCRFGKHKGKLWTEIESSYLEWILRADFEEDVVFTATYVLQQRKASELPSS